ncbi:hypothetical protein GY21_14440 [Cryobacterium roopkundense]|uniref:Aminoglycoside phosphotransferase domain-containing protein n=1 Tax=Cryobacterium roopkundense TaxID=1001240 RepID=A0A099J2R2_9MICO|nr:hypothetical protein GY21_14440 [Cryobacterium roopkundense]
MTTTTDPAAPLADAADVLEAVAESVGMALVSFRRFSLETTARGFAAGYELQLESAEDRPETHTVYLESNPTRRERAGVLTFHDEESGESIAAWLYPNDPELPALAAAVYPQAAAVLLGRLGLTPSDLELSVAAYRPGKRAVVRLVAPEFTVYLKVVRPAAAAALHARHELWIGHGIPVPRSLGWSADGFIALSAVAGVESSQLVHRLAPDEFLDALDGLTDQIRDIASVGDARASLAVRLPWYRDRLLALLPQHRAFLTAIGAAIELLRLATPAAPPVTIHGDLHLGQIFVDPRQVHSAARITGVLDIDTAGLGDPADDAAALYAHLLVSAMHHEARGDDSLASACRTLADRARGRWADRTDPGFADRARFISATHLLGHALGLSLHSAALLHAAGELVHVTPPTDTDGAAI